MAVGYNEESIQLLTGADRVRKRAPVIFGTADADGCFHAIFEIIANAVDEAREGHCSKIDIVVGDDLSIKVSDNGRGVPMGYNEREKRYNWELVFNEMYAGGKMDDFAYKESLGMNGLGAASCQYASRWFTVDSRYGGKRYHIEFERGVPVGELQVFDEPGEPSGTTIHFLPDTEVFSSINIETHRYVEAIRQQAIQIPGLTFTFKCPELVREVTIAYPGGAKQFLEELHSDKLVGGQAYSSEASGTADDKDGREPYSVKANITLAFTRDDPSQEVYHNGSPLVDGGASFDGVSVGAVMWAEEAAIRDGKLSKSDKILWKDVQDILCCVVETYCPGPRSQFKNQTKTAITKKGIGVFVALSVKDALDTWASLDKASANRVVEEILLNKKARESAESVKKKVLKKLAADMDAKNSELPEKFVDCRSRNSDERELYIVEGDSALGACKLSRDANFQALMPVRGKILNCLKADLSRILNSDIIVDLCRIIGCGLEVQSKHIKDLPKFDINKLRYKRIIICTDADIDGMQIRCLLIAMFYRLMPTLLKEGYIYIAETPLFEITYGEKDAAFAYSNDGRDNVLKEWEAKGYNMNKVEIARSKGLGENNPEMMAISTMHPDTRKLVGVEMPEITSNVAQVFEALLGNDLEGRKYLINEYMERDRDDTDTPMDVAG